MTYDTLPLIPSLMAETVCQTQYMGIEFSSHSYDHNQVTKTEALRSRMTPRQVDEFVQYCDKRCRYAFDHKLKWFMKCVNSTTNKGRDQLFVWLSHWMAAYLNNPAIVNH